MSSGSQGRTLRREAASLFGSRSREADDSVLVNGARGTRDIEGKVMRVGASELGCERVSKPSAPAMLVALDLQRVQDNAFQAKGGSGGKPGRCFASVTAPKTMRKESTKAQTIGGKAAYVSANALGQRVPPETVKDQSTKSPRTLLNTSSNFSAVTFPTECRMTCCSTVKRRCGRMTQG
jgi:hypothetical protein